MNKLWIVTKNELIRYFLSPLAYVYLVSFLILNGSFAIYFGHFIEIGQANLYAMFAFQPWLYLLFIPGISMRLWSEEFRNKTVVQIMTMPVSTSQLVWGKFFASWLFCGLALILTFPFWITVNYLGNPDNMVIAIGYLGSFILAGCMLAISQTMSALTKNQVIALVLSVIANMMFFLSGLEYVLALFRLFAPLAIVDMVASFSFITHFETISQGLLELRDIVFFASIILLFNFTTIIIVSFKTSGTSKVLKSRSKNYYILVFVLLLIGFVGLNLTANNLFRNIQIDFTQEKIFTLSKDTKKLLDNLQEPIIAKVYYSKILSEKNPEFRLAFDKLRQLLKQYANLSKGQFTYQIYNPQTLDSVEDRAIANGLQPFPVIDTNQTAFFGMTLTDSKDNKQVIPFFALERKDFLEQDLSESIYLLDHKKPTLGIISSLPIYDTSIENVVTQKWEIINRLEKFYNIKAIDNQNPSIENLDILMLIHPRNMSEELITNIKNYSNNGGKSLVLLDVAAEASRNFAPSMEELAPSNLGGLDKFWGFKFYDNVVVADFENSITVDATIDYKTNPIITQDVIQFILKRGDLNIKFPETKNLKTVLMSSASIIEPLDDKQVTFIPLIKSSPVSALMEAKVVYDNINPSDILGDFKADQATKYLAAKIISNNPNQPFEIIVVGDSDFIYDSFWSKSITINETNYFIPIFDNANFIFNALNSLQGQDDLMDLRGKSANIRSFKKLDNIRKIGQQQYKIKEQEILDKMSKTRDGIREILGKKAFEGRDNFTADELAIISKVRKELEALREEIGNIKNNVYQELRQTESMIKFINIYALPLLILAFIIGYFILQKSKGLNLQQSSIKFNRQLLYLTAISLGLLTLGILTSRILNSNALDKYEGQVVFDNLSNKINQIERINIKSNQEELNFYKTGNQWKLKGKEAFLVYHDRMRSFLSALIEARYYEKKSARAENLSAFDLQPLEVKGSKNIHIELLDAQQEPLESFAVGKYNIDMGRGSQGAYIKFDNQFQVWMIAAEFIDLSPKWQEWTYSSLWNLRFGRIGSYNNINDIDRVAILVRDLLNIRALDGIYTLNNPLELFQINLAVEGNNQAIIIISEANGKYYASYKFSADNTDKNLNIFADYTRNKFYEISKNDMEKLKDAINLK